MQTVMIFLHPEPSSGAELYEISGAFLCLRGSRGFSDKTH